MTDDEFAQLCAAHEDLRFELTADGELIVQPMPYNVTAKAGGEALLANGDAGGS